MTSLSLFYHLPFITGSNCSTSYCNRISHWWLYQSVTSANGLFERFWHYTVKQEDSNNLFCMTLGTWRWDGEVGIFCLAELYVHINDYDIERDAQVTRFDLFYSFALAHTFLYYFCQTSQFSHSQSSSHWKFVGSYDNKLLFIVSWWYKELIVVKIHEILKRWNVLVVIS